MQFVHVATDVIVLRRNVVLNLDIAVLDALEPALGFLHGDPSFLERRVDVLEVEDVPIAVRRTEVLRVRQAVDSLSLH